METEYKVVKEYYGTNVPLFIVTGPGLDSAGGIAFMEETEAKSCLIAVTKVRNYYVDKDNK